MKFLEIPDEIQWDLRVKLRSLLNEKNLNVNEKKRNLSIWQDSEEVNVLNTSELTKKVLSVHHQICFYIFLGLVAVESSSKCMYRGWRHHKNHWLSFTHHLVICAMIKILLKRRNSLNLFLCKLSAEISIEFHCDNDWINKSLIAEFLNRSDEFCWGFFISFWKLLGIFGNELVGSWHWKTVLWGRKCF